MARGVNFGLAFALVIASGVVGSLVSTLIPTIRAPVLYTVITLVFGLAYYFLDDMSRNYKFGYVGQGKGTGVVSKLSGYLGKFNEQQGGTLKGRKEGYKEMTQDFYDLVTDIYHYGWGDAFHFGARFEGEGFLESIRKDEYWLVHRGGMQKGEKWLDLGCGISGPLCHIVRFTEAHVTGVNINKYQVERGRQKIIEEGLRDLAWVEECDFMKLPEKFGKNSVDGVYAIEATCHAPDKIGCYKAIFETLKPGACMVFFEWCMTKTYDPNNPEHRAIKEGIETHNSLPELATEDEIIEALKKVGFVVEEAFDRTGVEQNKLNTVPWYATIDASYSLANWPASWWGQVILNAMIKAMELIKLAPPGSAATHKALCRGLVPLVNGGKTMCFSPHFYCRARKPLNA
ncbi:unnamed protein product [Vitrella brassicaformis CCMP3155]|uniref:Methyltransferase n=2 Tax=Vitrella brassicaformis TaxID=1169539 RepID=A0A0G4ELH8_VITBC|nr:unnamed protein product [Vitrella brassicaformis CCMP3155]|eukprot:CEL97673.1 unnamed protein product [Vitrella brassicaformis CCMP3155]